MTKITVVTAFNAKNAGMYSVDLAAEQFLKSHGYSTRLIRTQAKRSWLKPRFGRQRFELIRDPDRLFDTDILVYWGDFTTNLLYGLNDFPRRDLSFGFSKTKESALENWMRLFLPVLANPKVPVYSIGQNFHSLDQSLSLLHPDLRSEIENRYRLSFDAMVPRDDLSLQSLKKLNVGDTGVKVFQGLDTAMLLDHQTLYPGLKKIRQSDTFAYVFGRANFLQLPELLLELEDKSGLKGVDLPFWHNLSSLNADRQMRHMLEAISAAKFVLTDTYHCAVNAITMGKPVYCLGLNQTTQSTTVGEPKKRILFQMMKLMDNYIEFSDHRLDKVSRDLIVDKITARIGANGETTKHISNIISDFRLTVATTLQTGMVKR